MSSAATIARPAARSAMPVARAKSASTVGAGAPTTDHLAGYHRGGPSLRIGAALQPKPAVGRPGDPYEREADAVAERVHAGAPVSGISNVDPSALQRLAQHQPDAAPASVVSAPPLGDYADERNDQEVDPPDVAQPQHDPDAPSEPWRSDDGIAATGLGVLQKCGSNQCDCSPAERATNEGVHGEAAIQAATAPGAHGAPTTNVKVAVDSSRGGNPLRSSIRGPLEDRIGVDLGRVRVHEGTLAAGANRALGARAFTHGEDIWLASGESPTDLKLLAHESTHVVQQAGGWAADSGAPGLVGSGSNRAVGGIGVRSHERVGARSVGMAGPHGLSAAAPASVVQRQQGATATAGDDAAIMEELRRSIEAAHRDASQDDDLMLRAYASRQELLLTWRTRPTLRSTSDLERFAADCDRLAMTELDTLGAFSPAAVELALMGFPKGFPLTWSGRVHEALTLHTELLPLVAEVWEHWTGLENRAKLLPPQIFANGLPVSMENLARVDRFRLRLTDSRGPRSSAVSDFASAGIRWMQVQWFAAFIWRWEQIANDVASSVADGTLVASWADWKSFLDNKQAILRGLPARARDVLARTEEEAALFQTSTLALGDAALLAGMASGLASLFALLGGWSRVSALFDGALATADGMVAGSGNGEKLKAALRWMWENGYLGAAAEDQVSTLIDNAPAILAEIGLILILGMIPGVNIAVAVYLAVTAARDVIGLIDQTASAINAVFQARNVAQLQRASARLAEALSAGGITIATILATEGVARAASRIRARGRALRAADRTLTEQAAERRAFEQMSAEERRALDSPKVRTAERVARKFEELGSVCTIGSVRCRVHARQCLDEAGPYPRVAPVPMPDGPFTIQKAALIETSRGTEHLRGFARANRHRWPDFDRALARAEARGETWVRDANGNPWEVHHVKPVFMGGRSVADNLIPLPRAVHQQYTNWWNALGRAYRNRFTADEWNLIYWDERHVQGSRVRQTPVR